MNQDELNKILEEHDWWLENNSLGTRADLSYADLRFADLRRANLSGAILSWANLGGADLQQADLTYANLRCATLIAANLRNARLKFANLDESDLTCANLTSADLAEASMRGSLLSKSENIPFLPETIICPEKGLFTGFKKVRNFIIELEIPAEAKRSSATSRKCRCEFAKTVAITTIDGSPSNVGKVVNDNHAGCVYEIGKIAYPDSFDDDRWNECSHGIHFFITRREAVEY